MDIHNTRSFFVKVHRREIDIVDKLISDFLSKNFLL